MEKSYGMVINRFKTEIKAFCEFNRQFYPCYRIIWDSQKKIEKI